MNGRIRGNGWGNWRRALRSWWKLCSPFTFYSKMMGFFKTLSKSWLKYSFSFTYINSTWPFQWSLKMNTLQNEFTVSSYCEIELPILSLPGAASSLGWGSWNSSSLWSACACVCRQQAMLHPVSSLHLASPVSGPTTLKSKRAAGVCLSFSSWLLSNSPHFSISSVLLVRSQFFMPAIVSFFLLLELRSCHSNCC